MSFFFLSFVVLCCCFFLLFLCFVQFDQSHKLYVHYANWHHEYYVIFLCDWCTMSCVDIGTLETFILGSSTPVSLSPTQSPLSFLMFFCCWGGRGGVNLQTNVTCITRPPNRDGPWRYCILATCVWCGVVCVWCGVVWCVCLVSCVFQCIILPSNNDSVVWKKKITTRQLQGIRESERERGDEEKGGIENR